MKTRVTLLLIFGVAAGAWEGYARFAEPRLKDFSLSQRTPPSPPAQTAGSSVVKGDTSLIVARRVQTTRVPPVKDVTTISIVNPAQACDARLVHAEKFAALAFVTAADGTTREALNVGGNLARPPAALTKMMTLLVAFTRLDAKKLKLSDKVQGNTSVEELITAIGSQAPNDASIALAEKIAGTQAQFVALMNGVAAHIGMTKTVFANATGAPDAGQVTTARDMMVLETYIENSYPHYLKYLSVRSPGLAGLGAPWRPGWLKAGSTDISGSHVILRAERSVPGGKKQILRVAVLGGKSLENSGLCAAAIAAKL